MSTKSTTPTSEEVKELNGDRQIQEYKQEEIPSELKGISSPYYKEQVTKNALEEVKTLEKGVTRHKRDGDDPLTQFLALHEFDKGALVTLGFQEVYRPLVLNMSQDLQREYSCETASEKATAHLVAQNYVRTLDLQRQMFNVMNAESYGELSMKRYKLLSKEYERAHRQYLLSLQTLKQLKEPPINVNLSAKNAMLNQFMQINKEHVLKYSDDENNKTK